MRLLSDRALKSIRAVVDRGLVDVVEVRRKDWEHTLNEDTLVGGYGDGEQVYQGRARVRPTNAQTEAVGESVVMLRNAQITFPDSAPQIRRDDLVRVIDSPNSDLWERWFHVTEERIAGQEGFKRVTALSIAPSRTWRGGNVDTGGS